VARLRPRLSRAYAGAIGLVLISTGLLISAEISAAGLLLCVLGVIAFWLPIPRRH
jgi:hypothetical protein